MQSKDKIPCVQLSERQWKYLLLKSNFRDQSAPEVFFEARATANNSIKVAGNLNSETWLKRNESIRRVHSPEGIAPTTPTGTGGGVMTKIMVKEATKQGYAIAEEGDSINLSVPNSTTRRGRVGKGIAQTLDTGMQQYTISNQNNAENKTNAIKELSILREKIGAASFRKWEIARLREFQSDKVLQQGVHVGSVRQQTSEKEPELDDSPSSCKEVEAERELRSMWERKCNGCASYGQELEEQFIDELDEDLQELSQQSSSHRIRRLTPLEAERLMGLPDGWTAKGIDIDYHIAYNIDSNNNNKLSICKKSTIKKLNGKNVQWKIVSGNKLPISVIVSSIISDGKEQEQQNLLRELSKEIQSVNIAIKKSETLGQWECVINIIKCGDYMEMPFTWRISEVGQDIQAISGTERGNQSTELLWKNISEENLNHQKYLTILMELKPIIESLIYTFAQELNTQLSINNLTVSSQNQLIATILYLKTESITKISDSSRYKLCGNGVVVNVVEEIIRQLIIN